ncbi:MAG: carbon storage regulator CsrA [Defluviitaleaceae bacterium]|nr:carbon storage regulator CsrA [Defluviitaleaceae bacterium]
MLALTRRKGETIVIGDDIIITVLSVAGDTVKIGIDAPRNIPVNRQEVYLQIQEQNKQAAETTVKDVSELVKLMVRTKK